MAGFNTIDLFKLSKFRLMFIDEWKINSQGPCFDQNRLFKEVKKDDLNSSMNFKYKRFGFEKNPLDITSFDVSLETIEIVCKLLGPPG